MAERAGRSPWTYREVGRASGLEPGAPEGLYQDTTGVHPDETIDIDGAAAGQVDAWFTVGDEALRRLAHDVTPVLWPEHFDLSSTVGEVNFGVSPGDAAHPLPYAYVGPWTARTGEFWNASFGAQRSREEVDTAAGLLQFFEEGRARVAEGT